MKRRTASGRGAPTPRKGRLGDGEALLGGPAHPLEGPGVRCLGPAPVLIVGARHLLRPRVTLLGGPQEPFEGLAVAVPASASVAAGFGPGAVASR